MTVMKSNRKKTPQDPSISDISDISDLRFHSRVYADSRGKGKDVKQFYETLNTQLYHIVKRYTETHISPEAYEKKPDIQWKGDLAQRKNAVTSEFQKVLAKKFGRISASNLVWNTRLEVAKKIMKTNPQNSYCKDFLQAIEREQERLKNKKLIRDGVSIPKQHDPITQRIHATGLRRRKWTTTITPSSPSNPSQAPANKEKYL